MVIAHLISLSGNADSKKIIVDGFFSVEILQRISEYNRVVFLLSSEEVVRREYFNRDCKRDMYECINGLRYPEAAFENVSWSGLPTAAAPFLVKPNEQNNATLLLNPTFIIQCQALGIGGIA
ncbi:hypothetical protein GZH47_00020 [Paenibacillus rhizovicinus]|uniref:Uncharacterized protein n=1 Tax=Paenibacillus rhizovicinus TaxID=2704463 RepID=A0A6C0NT45_9BACL|nr:hypothetical protein [Paenibacillus rhizovicinus]QHW29370.1 hypothetical protein GZH47_00020 [Paenibacillus rhizovicinus]